MGYKKRVRANIMAEMGRRELRQADVARLLDTSQKNVSRRLHGEVDWKLGELLRLSQAWEIELATLLDGAEAEPFPSNVASEEVVR
ncbi:helix-turn-helix domain-containing protein [Brevibacterium jeotgali]|uniref:BetR domain-containing protein n=1 Tax=Brevibacterium jeotgali TaxID=1262550 RepID=A0A2H1L8R2_9MICO|nr:helix-turn-helix domain-containing protein [Brevibacterium jeotgali]TWC03268.1 BetR domain-containing protein [Brevibacterium jeotgali]SMY13276.1 BetR domain-containing protein [Brevibacterium jeotgali]